MKIKCYVSPIIIKIAHADYALMMNIVDKNLTYDDGQDRYMLFHEILKERRTALF
jgi:hypothetical protein